MLSQKSTAVDKTELKAYLSDGTEFKGLLTFSGTVRIDGKYEGEVITKDILIVGETAQVQAEVNVGHVVVKGKLIGNVNATQKIEIATSGQIVGNIRTPSLLMAEGGILEGQCEMIKKESAPARPQPTSAARPATAPTTIPVARPAAAPTPAVGTPPTRDFRGVPNPPPKN